MKRTGRFIAGLALASFLFAAPVSAQDSGSMQVGNATVTVGGGTAILTLPDVPSLMLRGEDDENGALLQTFKSSDDFGNEWGWNVNGSISVPLEANKTVSLNGFWANIEDDGSATCDSFAGGDERCAVVNLVDDPQVADINGALRSTVSSRSSRDMDHWGVSLESKWTQSQGVMGVTQAPPRRTFAVAADIRGIDQELDENINQVGGGFTATYREDLDTRYYGAYAAWGGDYSPLLFKGLWERWGLQSSFLLSGGVYYADTDYDGRLTSSGGECEHCAPGTSTLSLSDDEVAFIGGLVMETRRRIGRRAMLSLESVYEYYSYVPEMAYNQQDDFLPSSGAFAHPTGQAGTRIGDDDAFSARTSLRLTIKLGPDSIMEPLK